MIHLPFTEGTGFAYNYTNNNIILTCRVIPANDIDSFEELPTGKKREDPARPHGRLAKRDHTPLKPVSRVSTVKKFLNKKIKLNTHIRFDEEGEEFQVTEHQKQHESVKDSDGESNVTLSITPVPIVEYESLRERGEAVGDVVGGIEISKAQKRIFARDRIDRRTEKERVHQLHRKRRLKGRQPRMAAEGGDDDGVVLASPGEEKGGYNHVSVVDQEKSQQSTMDAKLLDDEELAKHLLGI